jgi:hypothetical protein
MFGIVSFVISEGKNKSGAEFTGASTLSSAQKRMKETGKVETPRNKRKKEKVSWKSSMILRVVQCEVNYTNSCLKMNHQHWTPC